MSEPIAKYIRELKGRMEVPQELMNDIEKASTKGEAKRMVKAYLQQKDAPVKEPEKKVKSGGKAKKGR